MTRLFRRLLHLARLRRHDDELAEELAFHREAKRRDLEAHGMPAANAAAAARRALGNDLAARQYARDVWISAALQDLLQDIRFGTRLLTRDRGFAVLAMLVLGFGIGVNNMLFTVLYAHTIRGLPIREADRVFSISAVDGQRADAPLSMREFEDLRDTATAFMGLAAFVAAPVALGDEHRVPDRFDGAYTTANAFRLLGIDPILGRAFLEDDETQGAPLTVILGEDAWAARYQRDRSIVGRDIRVNGAPARIIGVVPSRSGFPATAEIWLPLTHFEADKRDTRTLRVFGRLTDAARPSDAASQVSSIARRWAQQQGGGARSRQLRAVPINDRILGRLTDPAWLAFMTFGCVVLAISCANVANLMLTRAARRGREAAVRTALGATRARLVRQMLVECLVLAAAGATVGLAVSLGGVQVFRSAIPQGLLPYWFDYAMDARVFAALAIVSLVAVSVFGPVPALHASRADVVTVLKGTGRAIVRRSPRRWTTAFMAFQIGLSVVGLAYYVVDVGTAPIGIASDATLETDDILTVTVSLPVGAYPAVEQRRAFFGRLTESAASIPGVTSAALASALPRRGASERRAEVEGRAEAARDRPVVWTIAVGAGYFDTLGLPLERGRDFFTRDRELDTSGVIVNHRLADLLFPGTDPIGRRLRFVNDEASDAAARWLTIVGVAQNIRQRPAPVAEPVAYLPFESTAPATANLLMRASEHTALPRVLRERVLALDPDLPVYRVLTMSQVIDEVEWNGRLSSRVVRSITLLALAFALVGLYAVTAHAVAERSQEIAVRIAVGAQPVHVSRLVLARAAGQVALGFGFGILCTLAWDAVFFRGSIDSRFAHTGVLAPIAAVLFAGMCLVCVLPARRASRIDPVVALKSQ